MTYLRIFTMKPFTRTYTKPENVFTGVGNRDAPKGALWLGFHISERLYKLGYTLRSGGAEGMDEAFYQGCAKRAEVYPPWANFNGFRLEHVVPTAAFKLAEEIITPEVYNHPKRAKSYKLLHARNMQEVLGPYCDPDHKSDFLICYTRDGCTGKDSRTSDTGGTASAILCAEKFNLGVINLFHASWAETLGVYTGQNFFDIQDKFYSLFGTNEERSLFQGI